MRTRATGTVKGPGTSEFPFRVVTICKEAQWPNMNTTRRMGSVAKFDFWAKSKNWVSGIQRLTDSQTLEKATLRQNPGNTIGYDLLPEQLVSVLGVIRTFVLHALVEYSPPFMAYLG